jgi:hypothetical protein
MQNDQEGPRTVDDDNFIDDSGVDPADRYGSDNDRSPTHLPQVSACISVFFYIKGFVYSH